MKPIIYWSPDDGRYICELHQSDFHEDFDEQQYRIFMSCGVGKTPREAYEDWVRDCKR